LPSGAVKETQDSGFSGACGRPVRYKGKRPVEPCKASLLPDQEHRHVYRRRDRAARDGDTHRLPQLPEVQPVRFGHSPDRAWWRGELGTAGFTLLEEGHDRGAVWFLARAARGLPERHDSAR